jgi:hypothetical protein
MGAKMITDEELNAKIEKVTEEFKGQIDYLYEAVGMIVVGRLVGWEVMRLVSSRRCWSTASKWFGDPKELMPRRGRYAYKSVGLKLVDKMGEYWAVVRGNVHMPMEDRRMMQ